MRRMQLWAALVAGLLAAGCGINKATHQKVLNNLATCQQDFDAAAAARDENGAKASKLEAEVLKLNGALEHEKSARQQVAAALNELGTNLESTRSELDGVRAQRAATEKRLAAYRALNERFRALVDTGKLRVDFRNGMMVLKLPAGVLFPSGKARLSRDGEPALDEVLQILLEFKDRRFMIAGHTDNLRIRNKRFKNNWYLSTARALSVVQAMIDAGFDARNLSAAGYGEFDPVAENNTKEGRQLNRRIEILLVPDLSELPNLTAEAKTPTEARAPAAEPAPAPAATPVQ